MRVGRHRGGRKLREAGLEARDAAIVAVLVAEQGGQRRHQADRVPDLLAAGRLREAGPPRCRLPAEDVCGRTRMQQIEAAQQRLDELIAAVRAAQRGARRGPRPGAA